MVVPQHLAGFDVAVPGQRDERRRREVRQALDIVEGQPARVAPDQRDERALQRGRGQAQPVGRRAGVVDARPAREGIGAGWELDRDHGHQV